MLNKFYIWVEKFLFYPNIFQKILAILLLPISFLVCLVSIMKRIISKPVDFDIKIISIGNLSIGGSGKTPFSISLARHFDKSCIILRGYKRKTSGLQIVSLWGEIKLDVSKSGDEAMLYAQSLKKSLIIVSADRVEAIKKAKELGAKIILLDDAFHKFNIKKYDILLHGKNPTLPFCIPSAGYKNPPFFKKYANLNLYENTHFKRIVQVKNPTKNMILITAISNPKRLDKFLPKVIKKIYFIDHHDYKKNELLNLIAKYNASSILTTTKDAVKMQNFNLKLSILELEIIINDEIVEKIKKSI